MSSVKHPGVEVQLTGTDGNAFALIATVRKAIARKIGRNAADEFSREAMNQPSYDALLAFIMATVEVA